MTEGSDAGLNARGLRFGDQGVGSPDFARNDRGDVDDHWSRAVGQTCGRCAAELTSREFVRRRPDGTWVHQACPGDAQQVSEGRVPIHLTVDGRSAGSRHRERVLVALAITSFAATVWYLLPGLPLTITVMVAAAAVLAVPLVLWKQGPYTRIAVAWSAGGLIGAYLFGVFVLAAALVLWVVIALAAWRGRARVVDL